MMPRQPSPYWKHFVKMNQSLAICRYCDKTITTSGNTSNLKCHYEAIHANEKSKSTVGNKRSNLDTLIGSNSKNLKTSTVDKSPKPECSFNSNFDSTPNPTPGCSSSSTSDCNSNSVEISSSSSTAASHNKENIKDVFTNITSYQKGGFKHTKLTDKILYMICKDSQPVATVEREGFQELIKYVAPNYKLPCRKTFSRRLDEKYEKMSNDYKKTLKSIKDITLTTDLWSDTLNTRSFLGITAHYLEGSEIISVVIGVYEFELAHTSANLEEKLREVCTEWGIDPDNIITIVTDNAANIVKAVEDFVGKRKCLGCCAHKINLVATNSIKNVQGLPNLIKKVKTIVTWFKQSNIASDALRAASDLKLKQDVETRWNSTFYMLIRFILLSTTVHGILFKHASAPPMVTTQELNELTEVSAVLKPLEEITREWSAEKYVTLSKVIPMINSLKEQLLVMEPKTPMAHQLKNIMLGEVNKRFGQVEKVPMFSIATLLDPRFKKLDFNSPVDCSHTVNTLKNMLLQNRPPASTLESSEPAEPVEIVSSE